MFQNTVHTYTSLYMEAERGNEMQAAKGHWGNQTSVTAKRTTFSVYVAPAQSSALYDTPKYQYWW